MIVLIIGVMMKSDPKYIIMPTKGYAKPFMGIILVKNRNIEYK